MPVKEVVDDWLEEGFSRFMYDPHEKVRHESSLIPSLRNDDGENITPRPLFPIFLGEVELDPNFLVEYFDAIENTLRKGKDKLNRTSTKEKDKEIFTSKKISPDGNDKLVTSIEYERKSIFLSTVIFQLFELPDYLVSKTSTQYENTLIKNNLYKNSLDWRQSRPNYFHSQSTQVGSADSVDKDIETTPVIHKDTQTLVNTYLMKEYYDRKETLMKTPPKTFRDYFKSRTKFRSYKEFLSNICDHTPVLKRVRNSLYVIEKILNYNTYKNTLLAYNNCAMDLEYIMQNPNEVGDIGTPLTRFHSTQSATRFIKVGLKPHLEFHLPSVNKDYSVTCVECSRKTPSLVVSGYGVLQSEEMNMSPRGMILCWNIHKCEYPERIYHTEEAVTCLEFSKTQPFLVAVGMRYGLITVFDLRLSDSNSHASNRLEKDRPNGTITSVRWTIKKFSLTRKTEILLAVSMDGLITSWSRGKTLEGSVLMTTKRKESSGGHTQLLLATDTAGMCLQINPGDEKVFVVGTVEGQVLQVDADDPEEYIQVYDCHNGSIHDLQWSPLVKDVFATSGSDQRMRIWEVGRLKPSKTIFLPDAVLRLALSNMKSTLFAVMTKKALFIYDFSIDMHKPVVEHQSEELRFLTCVVFCPRNNWILVGDSDGVISLHELTGVPDLEENQTDALKNTFLPEY